MHTHDADASPPVEIREHLRDRDDVMLDPVVFHRARKELKFKPSCDMFANAKHHQVPRYYSNEADPLSVGRDAFTANWAVEAAPYCNPPWPAITRTLQKIAHDRVRAMVVVPEWPSAPWQHLWSQLCEKEILIRDAIYLDDEGRLRPKPRWDTKIGILDG